MRKPTATGPCGCRLRGLLQCGPSSATTASVSMFHPLLVPTVAWPVLSVDTLDPCVMRRVGP